MAKIDFAQLHQPVYQLEQQTTVLEYHRRNKRVSHTIQSAIRCARLILKVLNYAFSDPRYAGVLQHGLEQAHSPSTGGGMEFQYVPERGTVWIHGEFDIERLREYVMAVPGQGATIETEYVDG
jgi:hypothetical protein